MSPLARTKQYFEKDLPDCETVVIEHFNKWAKRRIDTWGADLLVRQGAVGLAIQCTDDTHHAHHVTKSLENPLVANWLRMGVRFFIYSWGLKGARGKRKTYQMRVTQLVLNGDDTPRVL